MLFNPAIDFQFLYFAFAHPSSPLPSKKSTPARAAAAAASSPWEATLAKFLSASPPLKPTLLEV